jgi:predicted dehydrogenase
MNFAILGPGVVADFHKQAIAANAHLGARLVAIGHYDPGKFNQLSDKYGVPCLTRQELQDREDIDAVCICTPSGQHAEQVISFARSGKHVLVEKPMAIRLEDVDRMVEACDRAGVKLGVIYNRRVEPQFQRVAHAIQRGELGELTLATVTMPYVRSQQYYDSGGWRGTWALDGGGVLMNQGIHIVDLLVWYMGEPESVQAYAGTLQRTIAVEDTLVAAIKFKNGALGTLSATTTADPGFAHRIDIYGTKGGIQIVGEAIHLWKRADGTEVEMDHSRQEAGAGGDPRAIAATGHIGLVKDFIEAIREDRPPLIDASEGRRSLELILNLYREAGLI